MKKIAIYPGSFDPLTNGHLDIIERASTIFDEVIVLISFNPDKKGRFPIEIRERMVKESCKHLNNVKVDSFNGLVVRYAKEHDAKFLIRGLRAAGDYEYEWSLYSGNRFIDPSIDMVYLMAKPEKSIISSTAVMEFIRTGVDVSTLVPKAVYKIIEELKSK